MRRLLDIPNDRSSHAKPTPRGGGLALTVAHLAGVAAAGALGLASPGLIITLLGGGLAVAVVGFMDDHGHVSASLRLACHCAAFAWGMVWLGGLPPVDFGWGSFDLGWIGTVLLLLYLAWFLNLFNFMDGIDGIAGLQCVSMSVSAACLIAVNGYSLGAALPLWLLAAACTGFLWWNWPPAKIFMGDVGSGYLGYALGVLALWTVVEGWLTPWVWLILGGAFLADATVTLVVRAISGVKVATAHRSHAYQRLSRHWRSHRRVTLSVLLVNVVWLGPWAWIATMRPEFGLVASVVALTPLFVIALRLGAGRPGEISDSRSS
jgi:Fuc2NAc and GlcNAc transferase